MLTDFGQTTFGQFQCFGQFFGTPKAQTPKTPKPTFRPEPQTPQTQTQPQPGEEPDPSGPPCGTPATLILGLASTLHFWLCWCCCGYGCCGFPLPHPFSLFLFLSGCLLVEFWWCLKRWRPQMCAFGVLWLLCEAPEAPFIFSFFHFFSFAEASHQTCTFQGPGASNTTKFHEKTAIFFTAKWVREREKFGPPPFRASPFRTPFFWVSGPTLRGTTLRGPFFF